MVDETQQVIVAIDLNQQATDVQQFEPMFDPTLEQLETAGVDAAPAVFLANVGYCLNTNLEAAQQYARDVLIATGKGRAGEAFPQARDVLPEAASLRETMAHKLRGSSGRAHYSRWKAIVEPVFGQMKTRQNAGKLRLRGATGEWTLHALYRNIRKLGTKLTQERFENAPFRVTGSRKGPPHLAPLQEPQNAPNCALGA